MSCSLCCNHAGLLVIDVQDKLVKKVERSEEVLRCIQVMIAGFQIFKLPIIATEQNPKGLGETVPLLKDLLEPRPFPKTTFSCLKDSVIKEAICRSSVQQWVLVGMEAHICILQTAKDLLTLGKDVIVLNDGITSRSLYAFSTAIAELRDCGVRISSTETILFELVGDAAIPEFQQIRHLVQCLPIG